MVFVGNLLSGCPGFSPSSGGLSGAILALEELTTGNRVNAVGQERVVLV